MQVFIWVFMIAFIIYAFYNAYIVIFGKSILGIKKSRIQSSFGLLSEISISFLIILTLLDNPDLNNYLVNSNIVLFSIILGFLGGLGEIVFYFLQKNQDKRRTLL